MKEKLLTPRTVACVLLAVFALVSALWLAGVFSSPEFHAESIAALDDKKTTVMELTAAAALTSVAISAVPGDATTPIADQIAELGSYLLIVTGVLMLEKFLLTFTGLAAFRFLFPVACVCFILWLMVPKPQIKGFAFRLAVRLALLGAVLCAVIPVSLRVSDLFEDTFELQKKVDTAARAAEELEEETGDAGEKIDSIGDWFTALGEQITAGVSAAVDKAEAALSNFIDAVAVLLISHCVIPVLVLLLMLWVVKMTVSLPMGGSPRPPALPEHRSEKTEI